MADHRAEDLPGDLPMGTRVGAWRVVEALGRGGYGTVYGVERLGPGETGRFALKLALWPRDLRVDLEWEGDPTRVAPPPPLDPPSALATVSPEDVPIVTRESEPAVDRNRAPSPHRGRMRRVLGATVAMMSVFLAVAAWWRAHPDWQWTRAETEGRHSDSEDGGVVAVGDAGPFVATHSSPSRAPSTGLEKDMPKKPFPGQRLPPCREGFEEEIELTEGQKDTRSCWIKGSMSAAACKASGYEYRGGCYAPSYPPPKLPQSERP